jgi:hypothetical protein
MPTALAARHHRAPATLFLAFFAAVVVLLFSASGAFADTAKVTKVFGGPIAAGGACNANATATDTQAAKHTDFCVAFDADNNDGPSGEDLKSQIIDTPRGFSGDPDGFPQCTDAQFAVDASSNAACPANSQMGAVASTITVNLPGLGNIGLSPTGNVYNLNHSDNEVARLGIDLRPNALGIPQPDVKIIVRVTLRPSPDVGLRSYIDNLPQTADTILGNGRPLSLNSFALTFWGAASDHLSMAGKNFGFLGSECGVDQSTSLSATAYDGTRSSADSIKYKLTGCDSANIQFHPSAEYSTSESRPDVTAETSVKVRFGASTNPGYAPTAVRKTIVTLPEGLSFSGQIASGPDGLPLCTPEQFGQNVITHNTCPAATAVGTVAFKSPLLDHSLTGNAYLGPQPAPGALPDLYIEAQLGTADDAPRVKLVGKLTIDAQNRIVTTLDDLPEVLVTEFALTFRGGDHAAVVTPPTCGTFKGALSAFSYAKYTTSVDSTQDYTVNQDCDAVGTFAPAVDFKLDNPASAGGSSALTTTVARADRTQRLGKTQIDLPPGMLASLKGVPECTKDQAAASACPASTRVGSVNSLAGVGPAPYSAGGDVYLMARDSGSAAALSLHVPVKFGEVYLGDLNVPAQVVIRPDDLGLRVVADVPERFAGVPLNIRQLAIKLDRQNFPLSPTNCGVLNTSSTITSTTGAVAQAPASFQVSGCDKLKFEPQLDAAVNGQTGNKGRPNVQVRIQEADGYSALRQTFVTLPEGIGVDLTQIPRACSQEDFKASACPDIAKIGKVSGALAITDEPLAGDLYLLKPVPGKTLPGLGLAFKGRFSGNVAGTTAVDPKASQLVTQFESIPDLPLTSLQIDVSGGTGGIVIATTKLCSGTSVSFTGKFVAQSGPTVNRTTNTFCGSQLGALTPRVQARLGGVRKGKPTLVLTTTAPQATSVLKMKTIDITFPSGWTLSTSKAKSSKGVTLKQLTAKGKTSTKRISTRKLRVNLPSAGTTKARVLTRTGTLAIKSAKARKTKSKLAVTLTITYTNGQKTTMPIRLTPH